jgi:hypothetical protein
MKDYISTPEYIYIPFYMMKCDQFIYTMIFLHESMNSINQPDKADKKYNKLVK